MLTEWWKQIIREQPKPLSQGELEEIAQLSGATVREIETFLESEA